MSHPAADTGTPTRHLARPHLEEATVLTPRTLQLWPLTGIPEIKAGDDLVSVILGAADPALADGDVIVVTSKIVSKAEDRSRAAADRDAAIAAETVRVIAARDNAQIVENRLGIVGAAAGVDSSNVPEGTVLLLPEDPDRSARLIAAGIRAQTGREVGVIISDTIGRPWRDGQTDIAIGAAGVRVFDELGGTPDRTGRPLTVTRPCLADEMAAATDLVKGKTLGLPVAVIRGYADAVGPLDLPGAQSIIRSAEHDLFRQGSDLAYDEGFAAGIASIITKEEHTP